MGLQVRDALRRLCVEIGWSYAVFWRAIGRQDQMQLVWEDGYSASPGAPPAMSGFEAMDLLLKEKAGLRSSRSDRFADTGCQTDDGVSSLVYKVMANQVHVVGDGIIGRAALSGSHQWILPDSFGDYGSAPKDLADMSNQIVVGIQTIALIPVLPHGLLQLGSTQMVMENSRFINHVKSLFTQLGSHGFVSDITKRPLNQNVHLSASLGMTSVNQPGDFSSYISGLSALSSARCNQLALKSPSSATISQPSHSLSTQLHSRLPVDSMEMASSTTVSSKMISPTVLSQPTIVSEAEPIHRQPCQLEKGHVGAQVIYSNPDVSSIENATLQGSGSSSQHQSQILTSSLSSVHTFLEEQLMYITGSWDSANQHGSSLNNFKKPQLDAHGSKISRSARDPDIVSPFDQSRSTLNSNIIGKHCSFSGDTTSFRSWSPISSSRDIYQMLDRVDHSNSSQMLSGDPQLRHTIKESYALSSEGRQETDNILYESVHVSSTGFDEHQSFYGSQFDCQGGRMSSSNPGQESKRNNGSICIENNSGIASSKQNVNAHDQLELLPASNESPAWHESGNDFFDLFGLDNKSGPFHGILDDLLHSNDENARERSADVSTCITQADTGFSYHGVCNGLYSEASPDQLLDAVVAQMNSGVKQNMDDSSASYNNSLTTVSKSSPNNSPVPSSLVASPEQMHGEHLDLSPMLVKSEAAGSSSLLSACSVGKTGYSVDKTGDCSQKDEGYKSQISLWVENGQSLNCDSISAAHYKRIDEASKLNRKRSRPGENPRPRPKDRQMIQDRVKELREIVPNGAKCSIDALLEKTIKHMLFLQSVTKHADKLKEIGVPKIMNKEGGLLLKDNFEGGATWAFEVGSQSMICPIVVEDLNPPRQMLVEMLCQERGIFLEIADLIRGLGLTILKGVMEARNDKVWARFAVEANRDITRMEIFLSLVRLLEPNAGNSMVPKGAESLNMPHIFHPSSIPATGLSDHLR